MPILLELFGSYDVVAGDAEAFIVSVIIIETSRFPKWARNNQEGILGSPWHITTCFASASVQKDLGIGDGVVEPTGIIQCKTFAVSTALLFKVCTIKLCTTILQTITFIRVGIPTIVVCIHAVNTASICFLKTEPLL